VQLAYAHGIDFDEGLSTSSFAAAARGRDLGVGVGTTMTVKSAHHRTELELMQASRGDPARPTQSL
jgi:hypothetical protein